MRGMMPASWTISPRTMSQVARRRVLAGVFLSLFGFQGRRDGGGTYRGRPACRAPFRVFGGNSGAQCLEHFAVNPSALFCNLRTAVCGGRVGF